MKGILVQVFTTLVLSLGNFLTGSLMAWPSVALQTFESDQSPLDRPITSSESNLIGSLPAFGNLVATISTFWMSDTVGKKKAGILAGILFTLSNSLVITTTNLTWILIARFVAGVAMGITIVITIPYVGEISQDSIRGSLSSMLLFLYTFGMLGTYLIGWLCGYNMLNYFNLVISVLMVLMISVLKETPQFLLLKQKDREALLALQFYRGASKPTQQVLNEMASMLKQRDGEPDTHPTKKDVLKTIGDPEKEALRQEEIKVSSERQTSAWKDICTSKPTQRALSMVTIHVILLVFGGTVAITAYAAQLFATAAPSISQNMCSVILAVSFAVGSILSMVLSDLVGRRVLMLTSTSLSAVFLAFLASVLRWQWAPEWTVPAAVLAYSCCFQMGAASVPTIQLSECFASKHKNLASAVAISAMVVSNFVILSLFMPMISYLGLDGTFLAFSVICVVNAIVAYFIMRETKGCSIEEIQKMFENGFLYRR